MMCGMLRRWQPLIRRTGSLAILLIVSLLFSTGSGRQSARFTVTPGTVLVDERFQISLTE